MDRFLEYLVRPTFLLSVVLVAAVANLWRKRRETRMRLLWVTAPLVLLALISMPWAADLAIGSLEWQYDPVMPELVPSAAIVIASGPVAPNLEGDHHKVELSNDSFYRCMRALGLYQKWPHCRIFITRSNPQNDARQPRLSFIVHEFLVEQGVNPADIVVESNSVNTRESALAIAKLIQDSRPPQVVLIADARHMPLSARAFRKAGIDVIPSPCNFTAMGSRSGWDDFLPNPAGASRFQEAFREWLRLAYYWARGWI
jgi:uncharacterized SAM-binding protein YcdF (DUF218 family)